MATRKPPPENPRTWKANAKEFASLDKGEGWSFAILVACSVERGKAGRPAGNRRDRDDSSDTAKVSASAFAKEAHTSADRVLRYLNTWQLFADDGDVLPADKLEPWEVTEVTAPDRPWDRKTGGYYTAPASQRSAVDDRPLLPAQPAAVKGIPKSGKPVDEVKLLDGLPDDVKAEKPAKGSDPMLPDDIPPYSPPAVTGQTGGQQWAGESVSVPLTTDQCEAPRKITVQLVEAWVTETEELLTKLNGNEKRIFIDQLQSIITTLQESL
jgi:hypothetical protein